MANDKLGRPTKERNAVMRNQVSYLLWHGKIKTSVAKAKNVSSQTEKILTLAINSYLDTVKVKKTIKDDKGQKVEVEIINDGAKKLAARRRIMSYLYDLQEQRKEKEKKDVFEKRTNGINHPLVEKVFNVYAPKYAERAKEVNSFGGYTRITKLGARRGDASEIALIELI